MSQIYITSVVVILTALLPLLGIKFDSATLTSLTQAILTIIGGLYIMYRRWKMGGINFVGFRR